MDKVSKRLITKEFFVTKKILYPSIATIELKCRPFNDISRAMGAEQESKIVLNLDKDMAALFDSGGVYTIEFYREGEDVG